MTTSKPAIWFPAIRTHTGTDVFTERLVEGLNKQGIKAEITWLPLRAEYLPWTVPIPSPPKWATIVHVNTWLHHRFLPKSLPVVATLHHSVHDPKLRPYKGLLRALYHRYWIAPNERRVMRQAARVTAVSQFAADVAKKTLCDVPIQVIYNGVDTELFHPKMKDKQKDQPFRLLYVGAWRKLKGVDLLAPIMQELGEGFELYYTGGAAAEKDKVNMPNNMYDLGRLSQQEVILEMQNSDALLFPSRSEGFGLVVAEAMACGLPVIAMRGTAVDDVIEHEVTGYLCTQNLLKNFVQAVQQIDKGGLQFSQKARLRACSFFAHTKMVDEYVEFYKNITSKGSMSY
ncbi:glycosyltransferase family 4 protein [Acinetobacter sp. TR11]|uniref:glycosyltransferase family 4 protein n=1 Tax=Acinetobacter sp. TR11 TaxID=3003393 RepID=UPI0022AC4E03|nr:glycosyltransferase family 4 protein [Acinetobacter sp. TR11]WAU73836.1 glycosyltransferase family 4 protein [Acinetobacter sp. TR11]